MNILKSISLVTKKKFANKILYRFKKLFRSFEAENIGILFNNHSLFCCMFIIPIKLTIYVKTQETTEKIIFLILDLFILMTIFYRILTHINNVYK